MLVSFDRVDLKARLYLRLKGPLILDINSNLIPPRHLDKNDLTDGQRTYHIEFRFYLLRRGTLKIPINHG